MSIQYYDQNAQRFFDTTVAVDMSGLRARFLSCLPPNAMILDAGCGSGRDSKSFIEMGHQVTAFDACETLANLASAFIGQPVATESFESFDSPLQFDGIWACASLLHVPSCDLPNTLLKLGRLLVPGGAFYCSFKYGDDDTTRDGRHFTNCNEKRLSQFIEKTNLHVKEIWLTDDARPERNGEKWLNGILLNAA